MAKKRRTPAELLAVEEQRARDQAQRVRDARTRAAKEHADRGAVLARHVGEVVIRLAGVEEHAGDARAMIDWAVSHMSARGQAARERWRAPWDAAPEGDSSGDEGEPADPAPAPPEPQASWAKRVIGRIKPPATQAAPEPEPEAKPELEAPPMHGSPTIVEWDQDATALAGHLEFGEGPQRHRKAPAEVMAYAITRGIPPAALPKGERWRTESLQARGWVWRSERWFAPSRPVSGTGC